MSVVTDQTTPMLESVQQPRPTWRRLASIAAQVVLILITIGLIVAILLPVYVGPSKEKQRRDNPPGRRVTR
jgi:hypothetical protein